MADFSNIWHIDEKLIKCRNEKDKNGNVKFSYLWIVIDDKNNMIVTHVSHEKDIKNAKFALEKARIKAAKPPDSLLQMAYKLTKKLVRKHLKNPSVR